MPASRMKRVFFEAADCWVNLEKVSRTKKIFRGGNKNEATFGSKVGLEEDYLKFFEMCQTCDQDEYDPTYMLFLENLREHGNSYLCDVPSGHGVRSPLKYEDNDEFSDELKRKTPKSPTPTPTPSQLSRPTILTPRVPISSHTPLRRIPTGVDGRDGSDKPSKRAFTTQSPTSTPTTSTLRAPISSPSHILRMPTVNDCQNGLNKPSMRVSITKIPTSRPITLTPTTPTLYPPPIPRAPTTNDCHNVSVNPLKSSSRTQVPTPTPRAPTSSPTSSTISKTVQKLRDDIKKGRAVFRKKLEICCRRPYERKECKDLWRKVNARKPITIHMETRGREYAKEGGMGKSYLDTHLGLREEIKKVHSDPYKVLNLLRGFFFILAVHPQWNSAALDG